MIDRARPVLAGSHSHASSLAPSSGEALPKGMTASDDLSTLVAELDDLHDGLGALVTLLEDADHSAMPAPFNLARLLGTVQRHLDGIRDHATTMRNAARA